MRQAKVRRIEIEKSVGPVIARDDFLVRSALKLHSKQPLVGHVQHHRDSVRVVVRAALDAYSEILAVDQAAIAVLLKIEKAGCALDVGKCSWVLGFEQLKPFPARNTELQVSDKLMVMQLADPQEIENFLIEVV